jgi:hypothetical protein
MARTVNDNYYKIIIIGEDGVYKLEKADWKREDKKLDESTDTFATVTLLKEAGSYLAFIDPAIASGAGYACTVVNLEAIIREAKNRPGE